MYERENSFKQYVPKGKLTYVFFVKCSHLLQEACAAGQVEAGRLLITQGHANVQDRSQSNGWVPLHNAAMRGNIDCCELLLSYHASMHPRTVEGDTPRDLALRYGMHNVVEFLGKKFEFNGGNGFCQKSQCFGYHFGQN